MASYSVFCEGTRLRRRGRRLRRNALGLTAALGLSLFARSTGADTIDWTGGASGNWDVASNWTDTNNSSNVVPGSSDAVDILNSPYAAGQFAP